MIEPHGSDQRCRRLREQRARRVEQRLLPCRHRHADIVDCGWIAAERCPGCAVIKADALIGHHPPPRLANLKARRQSDRNRNLDECARDALQIGHCAAVRRRKQSRWRNIACRRRIAVKRALFPIVIGVRVIKLVGQRDDQAKSHRFYPRGKIFMPRAARGVDRAARKARVKPAACWFEPEIMAHPDIVVDRAAVAELQNAAQQPCRCLVVTVIISGREAKPVRGDDDVANREHR